MSSHHFVKEGQEPALLILDAIKLELVEPLLEWAPLLLVHEDALEKALAWGIKLDVVFAKRENAETLTSKLLSQAPIKILSSDPSSDLLENALNFLITTRQQAVSIIVNDGYPLFHKLENFTLKLNISLLTPTVKWSNIPSGSFKKWFPAGSKIILQGFDDPENILGLEGSGGNFTVMRDGILELKNKSPFWVGENL